MANTDVSPAAAPTNVRWSVFSLAFSISALLYLHRYVFAFIKPTLAEEYKLSNTQLGQLDSAFSVCYAGFQFPLGIAADVLGVHLVLTGLIVLWCAAMGLMAWAPSVSWLWFSRAALGTGQSAVYACLSRVARTWYPPAVRTTLQGSVGVLAGRLGALSSSVVFTTLLLGVWGLDWRSAVWILVAVGVVNVLLFVFDREQPLWLRDGYDARFALPKVAQGTGMSTEDARALRFPDPALFLEYVRALHTACVPRVAAMTDEYLAATVLLRPWGDLSRMEHIGQVLIAHTNSHLGKVSLARTLLGHEDLGF